ncbi:MAG: hypothetical protein ACE5FU_14700 [Nitrospinota bacterium]
MNEGIQRFIISKNAKWINVKELVESRAETKTGLKVFSDIIDKVCLTGKKATNSSLEKMPVLFDTLLPKWNYKAVSEY